MGDYDLQWLRQNIAVVSQEVVLFSTTIRQNIMYGNPHATEADMLEVTKFTNVDRMVEKFPQVDIVINGFCISDGKETFGMNFSLRSP